MPCDGHMRYECVVPYDMKASYALVIFLSIHAPYMALITLCYFKCVECEGCMVNT